MKSFNNWVKIIESKNGKKIKKITMPKVDGNVITGKIDQTKISTGHKPHQSGAGMHGSRPKPRKKDFKDELEK